MNSNVSALITIALRDTNNIQATATNNVTVSLSSSLSGSFRNVANTTNITSVVISNGQSQVSFRYRPTVLGTHNLTVSAAGLSSATQALTSVAQPVIVQTYFVPYAEENIYRALNTINTAATGTNAALISISAFASNTIIYYDHWEDGYESDLSNPTQSTTLVWGDGIAANGCPPNFTNIVSCSDAGDFIERGQAVVAINTMPSNPRNSADIRFDGRDRFGVTRPVAVTRFGWDVAPATLLAGSIEVFDISAHGTRFVVPVGTNVITESSAYELVLASIMPTRQSATVVVDYNNDGIPDLTTNVALGATLALTSNVLAGTVITSSAPVQVSLITGDIGSNYECRWYNVPPVDTWSSRYFNPVSSVNSAQGRLDVILYNPNSNAITVLRQYKTAVDDIFTTTNVIPGGSFAVVTNTEFNTAQYYYTTNNQAFYGIGQMDASGAGQISDWGFSLVPESFLTPIAFVGSAPGRDPFSSTSPNTNVSPIWVTVGSPKSTTLYVDYNGNGGAFTNDCGEYDASFPISYLDSLRVYDPDGDQTAMKLFTCDGTLITAAWGQDPLIAPAAQPSLDMGYTVLPLPGIDAEKSVAFAPGGDLNNDGFLNPGEIIRYTIIITNPNESVSGGVTVEDILPPEITYNTNTTLLDGGTPIADSGVTPFPLDEGGFFLGVLTAQTARVISFDATVINPYTNTSTVITNRARVRDDVSTVIVVTEVASPVVPPSLIIDKVSNVGAFFTNNQVITYSISVVNTSAILQTGIAVTDAIPSSVSFVTGSVFVTAPVQTGSLFTNRVRDDFSSASYSLNTGNVNWNGNWIEQNEATSPTANDIQIVDGRLRITNTNGAKPAIYREVNLANAIQASISLRYEASNNLEVIDSVQLQVSTNGGTSYIILADYTEIAGSQSGTTTVDITSYRTANTRVRLAVNAGYTGVDEFFRVDWLQVQFTTGVSARVTNTFAGTAPPVLHTGQSLFPGESMTITFQARVTNNIVGLTSIVNTACFTADGKPLPTCDSVVDLPPPPAGIRIDKTVSSNAFPGVETLTGTNNTPIVYWFVVRNTGLVNLASVTVNDPLIPYSTNLGSLAVGQAVTVSVNDVLSASLTNTATASGNPPGGLPPVTSTDTASVVRINPAITIAKTVSDTGAIPGVESVTGTNNQPVLYSFVVRNTGDVTLTNVVVTDNLISPALSTNIGTLTVNQARTVTASRVISSSLINTATAQGNPPLGPPVSNSDTASVTRISPAITIAKTVSDVGAIPGVETVTGTNNQPVLYSFVVRNTGDVTLTNVVVTDTLLSPSFTTNVGTLTVNQAVTVTANRVISGSLTNLATSTGVPPIGPPVSNSDTAVVVRINPAITIAKTVSDTGAIPGVESVTGTNNQPVLYSFVVRNTGDVILTNVVVTDTLLSPSYTTNIGTLTVNQARTVTANRVISGSLTNLATSTGVPPFGPPVSNSDTAVVVRINPAITIAKTVSDTGAIPGVETVTGTNNQPVLYSFVVRNTGDVTLTNVVVTDTLLSPSFTTNVGTLTVNQAVTVTANRVISGSLTNLATSTGVPPIGPPVSNSDTAVVVRINPAITIAKTVSGTGAIPGVETVTGTNNQPVLYSFVVRNTGDVTLTNVVVTDTLLSPSFTTNIGTLTVNQARTVTANRVISGSLTNLATSTGVPPIGPPVSNSDTAVVVRINPAITIAKTVSGTGAIPGVEFVTGTNNQPVLYSFVVRNTGDVTLTNVVVTDTILSPSYTTNIGTLAVNQARTVTANRVISGSLTNLATSTGVPPIGPPVSNSDTATVARINPAINIEKTVSATTNFANASELVTGTNSQPVTYFLVVSNPGDVTLTNVVVLDTSITPVYSNNLGTLVVGQSVTLSVARTIGGNLINTATTRGQDPLGQTQNDSDTAEVREIGPAINIEKTVATTNSFAASGELAIGTNGQPVTYFFVVSNPGDVVLTNVYVFDLSITPAYSNNLGTLAVGQSVTVSVASVISADLVNTAQARGFDTVGQPQNDSDTAEVDLRAPAITLIKTAGSAPNGTDLTILAGSNVTYTFRVINNGDTFLSNIAVTDNVIGVIGNIAGPLAPGATSSIPFTVSNLLFSVTNIGVAVGNPTDDGGADLPNFNDVRDDDDAVVIVTPVIDLELTKDVNNATPNVGSIINYTIVVSNRGPSVATGVTVLDVLPSGLSYVTSSNGTYVPGTGIWTIGSIGVGGQTSLVIVAAVTNSGSIENIAQVQTADQLDIDSTPGNNVPSEDDQDNAIITVPAAIDLELVKSVDDATPNVGQTIAFTIVLTNKGPNNATGVSVLDVIPPGFAYSSNTTSSGLFTPTNGIWTIGGPMVPGASRILVIYGVVTNSGTYTNVAQVQTADQFDIDSTPGNNDPAEDDQDDAVFTVPLTADLELEKGVNNSTPLLFETVTFTITVTNRGPDTATGVTVLDDLNVLCCGEYVSHTNGAYNPLTGIWNIGTLAVNASTQLFISVTITNSSLVDTNWAQVWTANEFDIDSTPGNSVPTEDDQDAAVLFVGDAIDLELTKTVDNAFANVGSDVVFTLTLTNKGPNAATGVSVEDVLPAGLDFVSSSSPDYDNVSGIWTVGAVSVNGSTSLLITATVTNFPPVTNAAQVLTADQFDIDSIPGNFPAVTEDDDDQVVVTPPTIDLELTKSVNKAQADPFENVTWTVIVTNRGPSDATGVTVRDELPVNWTYVSDSSGTYDTNTFLWTIGTLPAGGSTTLQIVAFANIGLTLTGHGPIVPGYTNIAQVWTANEYDIDSTPGNDVASEDDQDSAEIPIRALSDLALTKSVNNATPNFGSQITYSIIITNEGPQPAVGVRVEDILPAGLTYVSNSAGSAYNPLNGIWVIGTMNSGDSRQLDIFATVSSIGLISNVAQVNRNFHFDIDSTPDNDDPAEDDQDDAVIIVPPSADLELTKTVNTSLLSTGQVAVFTVTVTNAGPSNGTGIAVRDVLPSGLGYVSHTGGTYNAGTGIWTIGSLNVGSVTSIQITAQALLSGTWTNVAEVSAANEFDIDSTPNNNVPTEDDQDEVTVTVVSPNISIVKTVGFGPAFSTNDLVRGTNGTPVRYWFVVSNSSDTTLTNVTITDLDVPFTTNLGTLVVGQVRTVSVADVISADLTNTAVVTGQGPTGSTVTDDDTAVVLLLMKITGSVFLDIDGDGQFDPVDTNDINGVTVTLLNATNGVVGVTTTTVNGAYSFTNLPPGAYTVVQTDLPGYLSTGDTVPPNDNQIPVTLLSGIDSTGNNFLDTLPGQIGDFVWDDLNGNGIQDGGEPGISNVTVRLLDASNAVVFTTTTDNLGAYLFTNVAPAPGYVVEFVAPSGYVFTLANQGTNDLVDSDADVVTGRSGPITILSGESNTTIDAGLFIPSSISGSVFVDVDGDGIFDAEDTNGINGVIITLLDSSSNIVGVTTTAVNGAYSFTNLPPGDYTVVETDPPGYVSTGDVVPPNDNQIPVTLTSGSNVTGRDFLDTFPGQIGDFVWDDLNGNGIQDGGEPGISNVTVRLLDASNAVVFTTTTDNLGAYLFTNVAPAPGYVVEFVAPSGYVFTLANQGTNDLVDSDADVVTGRSGPITILSGESNTTIDAGLFIPSSISGSVFIDVNTDGNFDPEDTNGINGVIITLVNSSSNVVGVTTTAVNGAYSFTNLPPGAYTVVETDPVGFFSTGDVVPPNDNLIPVTLTSGSNVTGRDFLDAENPNPTLAKTFVEATDVDANGNFDIVYRITVINPAISGGTYDLTDTPSPDPNVTINGGSVSGFTNLTLVGAGPYTLADDAFIGATSTNIYVLTLNATLSEAVRSGSTNVSLCAGLPQDLAPGQGLFNEVVLTYGTNNTQLTSEDCGNIPPWLIIDKTFVAASAADVNGNFVATYVITVENIGGRTGPYDLTDTPLFDTNVTVSGGTVSGQVNTNLTGAGPYTLASGVLIGSGDVHTYTLALNATLSSAVRAGVASVTLCGEGDGTPVAGEGLFNETTVTFSTNSISVTTNDCGEIPPFLLIDKQFVSATEPDLSGAFTAVYNVTVENVGGSIGTYDLSDTPAPDTNITVNGASVSGQVTTNFTGAGPYALASGASIAVGATHTYTLSVSLTLESQVLAGAAFITTCGEGSGTPVAGEGLFNAATVTYGTNSTSITTNDCGDVPPFLLIDKTFVSASEPSLSGAFSATYNITVVNVGGQVGTYDLSDSPSPDTNVTVNGAAVTGQATNSFVGAGPYTLASGASIAVGATHTYTLTVDLTLEAQVLAGAVSVSLCGDGTGTPVAGEGLFNAATVTYGTNSTTITTNDCGEIPPFILIDKTFVSASPADTNGLFTITYNVTVENVGGTAGTYNLTDTPAPDTNVSILGVAVTGQVTTNFTGAGPYTLATGASIGAGVAQSYQLVFDAQLSMAVMDGTTFVTTCGEGNGTPVAGEGLFNAATVTYGTNSTTITTNDCGNIPPIVTIRKDFVSTTPIDTNGAFTVTYTITVDNSGGVAEIYDLSDLPTPDANVTILGGAVSGFATQTLVGAGPYTLATDASIAAGATHVYTLTLNAQLSTSVLSGSVSVSLCGERSGTPNAGEGLFNLATLAVGTNNTVITDDACGDIPPLLVPFKTFVSASEPDLNGDFSATYTITMVNVGGSSTTYDLVDTPAPDTNITVNGASVSGYAVLSFTNAGPYTLATDELIGAGSNHVYTLVLDLTLGEGIRTGISSASQCLPGSRGFEANNGLFNAVTATYGTNDTTVTTNACGEIPPFLLIDKQFVSATEPDLSGAFTAVYNVTVENVGGSIGTYDLSDTPAPDTNITVNGASVSGQVTTNFTGAGPYALASGASIAVGATHTYTLSVSLTLESQVLAGAAFITTCGEGSGTPVAGEGLFNAATVTYGTNSTSITTNDCGDVPPFLLIDKTFVSASEPSLSGAFSATYNITVVNVGGQVGTYDLSDSPSPDTNVTVNGAAVTGQATNSFVGAGPYTLASGASIAVGATHTYTLTVDLTLEAQVLAGAVSVSLCGDGTGTPVAGEGLFNAATVTYGTNSTTITTNDCGEIPPFILIDKTFVSASPADTNGLFTITYNVTVENVGGTAGTYNLTDTPAPDTNVSILGVAVTGQVTTNFTGAGPYTLATGASIGAGVAQSYQLVFDAQLSMAVMDGTTFVTTCGEGNGTPVAGEGLFNAATVTYGTNSTTITTNDCGNIPPIVTIRKDFVSTTPIDTNGAFTVTYTITVDNSGGVAEIYDLSDLPTPDANVTILGGAVSGFATQTLVGAGPYTLATDASIAAGATHVYTLTLNAQLSTSVLSGSVSVSLCGERSGTPNAGEGLFNLATLAVGTNNTVITDDACGDIPPLLVPFKTFVSASEPDLNGDFSATYTITMVNVGGSSTTYDLVDTPAPDTNITVNGASVSGYAVLSFTNAGPYTLATDELIGAGSNHVYTLVLDLTLGEGIRISRTFPLPCLESGFGYEANRGLYNRINVTYTTNEFPLEVEACGEIPPFILIDKFFVSATEADIDGNFVATYDVSVINVGGTEGTYDLTDTPSPDTNITVNGASVTGQITTNFTGAGPYTLATGEMLGEGAIHTYTLSVSMTLQSQVLAGASFVTLCGDGNGTPVSGEGLFNEATVIYGTNRTTISTNDCGEIPPFLFIDKSFVSAGDVDGGGNFVATYTVTVRNTGGSATTYDLTDALDPDLSITVNGGSVTGFTNLTLVGAGPYTLATDAAIDSGATHSYTLALNMTINSNVLNGTETISACSAEGRSEPGQGLYNEATVVFGTNDTTISTNACGDITATIRLFADPLCIDDAPYIQYLIVPIGFTPSNTATITWVNTNGVTVRVDTNLPLAGTLVWPGTTFDTNGVVTDWPGWVFTNGIWVVEDDGLRPFLTLIASVNPTNATVELYPPESPECSPNPPATIGDFVWDDLNLNGIQDPGEPGLSNIVVVLYDFTNGVAGVTTTDVNGAYAFQVRAGTYEVQFFPPTGYFFSPAFEGTNTAIDSNADAITGLSGPITVSAGQVEDTIDAGLFTTAFIAGSVFNDSNGNGLFDPEDITNGIPSVLITLLDGNSNVVTTTFTAADGSYIFTNLQPGVYTVVETDPAGFYSTADISAPNDNIIPGITIVSGQGSTGNDFLDARYAAVGDRVWLDFGNGIQDPGEAGLGGVRLTLFDSNNVVVGVTTSAPISGFYRFSNLVAGAYNIRISVPPGSGISPQFQGSDPTVDSDVNPTNAFTPVFVLVPGQNNTNVDAGLYDFQIYAAIVEVSGSIVQGTPVLAWETETEYGTAGWLVQRESADGRWITISGDLPALGSSQAGASYRWPDTGAEPGATYRYQLVELESRGSQRVSGPYEITYAKAGRTAQSAGAATFSATAKTFTPVVAQAGVRTLSAESGGTVIAAKVAITNDGLFRVTAAQLASVLGVDAAVVAASPVRVEHLGLEIPAQRDGDDVVFHARGYNSMFTDRNVYRLSLALAQPVPEQVVAGGSGVPVQSTIATVAVEQQLLLRPELFTDAQSDLWLWRQLISGIPSRAEFTAMVDVPHLVAGTPAQLTVRVKGGSPHAHGVVVQVNGQSVGSASFSGLAEHDLIVTLPAGLLTSGANSVRLSMTPPVGVTSDQVYLDRIQVMYQRALVAGDHGLVFDAPVGSVQVTGLNGSAIEVWDVTDVFQPVRLVGFAQSLQAGTWSVSFQAPRTGRYAVSAAPASPVAVTAWYANDLKVNTHEIDYLVIHGNGLGAGAHALAADRSAKGLRTKVVSMESVYDAFNHGITDARVLKAFLGYAYRQWQTGPRYVVFAGDSSLDYRNRLGTGDSLVPTPPEGSVFGVIASDHGLGDIDGDGHLEMAVGRIPVGSAAALNAYVAKMQAFEAGGSWRGSVTIAADNQDQGGSYEADGDELEALISGRSITRANIGELGAGGAASVLHDRLNAGTELAVYIGHGSFFKMADEGILTTNDVAGLVNASNPGVVMALGCLMGSFGQPGQVGIGEKLVAGANGAAAVLGSSTLVNIREGNKVGRGVVDGLYRQGVARLGDALVETKNAAASDGSFAGVATYQLLGDPALAFGDADAPRGGPEVEPTRSSYEEWLTWAFPPVWIEQGLGTDPNDDPDGDGLSNWEEYLAGTDPLDALSDLVVVTVRPQANGSIELRWPSVPGRTYRIERAESIGGPFTPVADLVPAAAPVNTWLDSQPLSGAAFYRVFVQ